MIITICGSMRALPEMEEVKSKLEELGHEVLMPVKDEHGEIDYWAEDNITRVRAKQKYGLISEHLNKIEKSDGILVVNTTKNDIENYIGANTFLEIGFAHHHNKKIYLLNPVSEQKYIIDEVQAIDPVVIHGDLTKLI